jgi:hypothetical protein
MTPLFLAHRSSVTPHSLLLPLMLLLLPLHHQVALAAPMLASLGHNPLNTVVCLLIMNTLATQFGEGHHHVSNITEV